MNESGEIQYGDIKLLPLGPDETASISIEPAKTFDAGAGNGKKVQAEVLGGTVGLFLDGRGRPLDVPQDHNRSKPMIDNWVKAVDLYPNGKT